MSSTKAASNTTAPTQFLQANGHSYAYRRFGNGSGLPLLCLQHFTGTLDNWDSAVTDPLASGRDVLLFDNAGVGRSTGDVPGTIAGMEGHAMAFLDELGIKRCDVIGYSLGGDGRASNGTGQAVDLSADDPRWNRAARRRRHHASRETEPGEACPGPHEPRVRCLEKDLLHIVARESGSW